MIGKTISEKIFSEHSGESVFANDIVIANLDYTMGHDGSFPLAIEVMKKLGNSIPFDSNKVGLIIDHYTPSPNENVSNLHKMMREYAHEYNCNLYDSGEGICHQLIPESGKILPGNLVIGGDSHTCTYGALNLFATGVGSTELAIGVTIGKMWFRVPETVKIIINGEFDDKVYAKDLILKIAKHFGSDGLTYKAVEFHGEGLASLSMESRLTMSNMVVEMGAKSGIMPYDSITEKWYEGRTIETIIPVYPDDDAKYSSTIEFNLTGLQPQVSLPHNVENSVDINEIEGLEIQQVNIGSCTNGKYEDLVIVADMLQGRKIAENLRLYITPASKTIYLKAIKEGLIEKMVDSGAIIVPPSCGWCCGSCNGIPSNYENVIATSNRNFKGRMGNNKANIYLSSPATAAISAIRGKITDPRRWEEI